MTSGDDDGYTASVVRTGVNGPAGAARYERFTLDGATNGAILGHRHRRRSSFGVVLIRADSDDLGGAFGSSRHLRHLRHGRATVPRVGIRSRDRSTKRKEARVSGLLSVSFDWDLGISILAPHSAARPNEVQPGRSPGIFFPAQAGTLTSFRWLGIRGGFTTITSARRASRRGHARGPSPHLGSSLHRPQV